SSARPNHDSRIDGNRAVFVNQQGVDVEFFDPRKFACHFRTSEQYLDDGLSIGSWLTAELTQQFVGARATDQIVGQEEVEGWESNCLVSQDFDGDAASPED